MKVLTVVGARPQFIKAAPVTAALQAAGHKEYMIHTGQHYDHTMSQIFFDELGISQPEINLGIGSGSHGWQTGQMLARLEEHIYTQKPEWVLVYGDTNSTLAGALAAVKLHVPIAHVESGLRSFNRSMPEEHNRVLTDHCADILFCPTQTAVNNLTYEGITDGVHLVGDTMYDAVLSFMNIAEQRSVILQSLRLAPNQYLLATVHRPYNTDDPDHLREILSAFASCGEPVIFPVHPRTRVRMADAGLLADFKNARHLHFVEPLGYLDMLTLEKNARMILTDSGGIQKEAYFFGVPCITLRPETEWVETVESGWNQVVGTDKTRILAAIESQRQPSGDLRQLFGDGKSAQRIVQIMTDVASRSE